MNETNFFLFSDFSYASLITNHLKPVFSKAQKIISNIALSVFTNSYNNFNYLKKNLSIPSLKLNSTYPQECLKIGKYTKVLFSSVKTIFKTNKLTNESTLSKKNLYSGEFKKNLRCGHGKLTMPNGDIYEGQFQNNLFNGKGKLVYSNGDIYEGDFKNNQIEGDGKLITSCGDIYEGEFKNNECEGNGKLLFKNGGGYEGQFKNNTFEGKGKLFLTNGDIYEGEFKNGKRDGKGKYQFLTGDVYEGDFKNNQWDGNGLLLFKNGDSYEGEFENNLYHGKGTFIGLNDNLKITGNWKCGVFLNNNKFDLCNIISQEFFAKFLLGKNKCGFAKGLWEHILSNLLKTIKNSKIQEKVALLENANKFSNQEPKIAADLILKDLKTLKKPCLIYYGCKDHAMGLLLTPKKNYIEITIFNSGLGLHQYHKEFISEGKIKYCTQATVLVPKENLNKDKIISILNISKKGTIDEAYEHIFQLENQCLQTSSPSQTIWQTPQKGQNCAIEWIFSFLKNTLPLKDYIELRIKIFEIALEGLEKNTTLSSEDKAAYQIELQRKVAKRKSKLEDLC